MNQYTERDAMELDDAGGYYIRHVCAMAKEHLHSKSDIAAELAYRDMIIDRQKERINQLLEQRNSTGIAIDNAIRGALPYEHPLLSRLGMIANIAKSHERNAQLLEQINNAKTSQYLSAADMLHGIKKIASRAIED